MRSQAEGLAEALHWPFESISVRLRRPWSWLPAHRQPPGFLRYGLQERLPQPWPDLLISLRPAQCLGLGCGPARRRRSGPSPCTYRTRKRASPTIFDLVVPPMQHDGLAGPNVVATRAALHRM